MRNASFVEVWDLPTRLFKWGLVLLVLLAWVSNAYGGAIPMWHKANGYAILVLIVFRILWGFTGGTTARFHNFITGPKAALSYASALLNREKPVYPGHNPLGGWMVVALMTAIGAQALLGLYAADEDRLIIEGPLARTVSDSMVDRAAHFHRLGFTLILVLVVLHIAANLFYDLVWKSGLTRAMVTGCKPRDKFLDQMEVQPGSWRAALLCLGGALLITFGGIAVLGGNPLR